MNHPDQRRKAVSIARCRHGAACRSDFDDRRLSWMPRRQDSEDVGSMREGLQDQPKTPLPFAFREGQGNPLLLQLANVPFKNPLDVGFHRSLMERGRHLQLIGKVFRQIPQ